MKTLRRSRRNHRRTYRKKEKGIILKQKLGDHLYFALMKSNNRIIVLKNMISKVEKNIHLFLSMKKEKNIPSLLCHGSSYIGMERLQGTLLDYFRMVHYDDNHCFRALIAILKNLKRLQERYSFIHRDLHGGNIMFKGVHGEPIFYFIDFEYACIKKKRMIYNVTDSDHYRCIHSFNAGHDIRMLYISLYQALHNQNETALYRFLEKYVGQDKAYEETYSSIIHEDNKEFYPDNMIQVLSLLILYNGINKIE
jgi:serine/threonine protein kinase